MPRNRQFDETGLMTRAVSHLRASLPPTWHVDVSGDREQNDTDLVISSGTGVPAVFTVQLKGYVGGSSDQVVSQLSAFARTSRNPLLFVTEYVNAPLRQKCREQGISYLDASGWVYVVRDEPPILIQLEGADKPPRSRGTSTTARLTGPATGRTIRCLLESVPPLGIRQLAELSSSSPAAVSKLMPALVDAGAVDRAEDGFVIRIRRRTLLNRWTADYSFLTSNGVVHDYLAPRGLQRTLDRILDRDDIRVTGSAAARTYLPPHVTPVVPLGLLALYSRNPLDTADSLGLVRASRDTGNVLVTTPRDSTLLERPRSSSAGLPVVPLGQVLADLLTLPGRLAQEAEQIMDALAETDPSWRE